MTESHLDQSVLLSLQDVMAGEYSLLLDTFLADSQERLRCIHSALAGRDASALRLAAHSFKGSCSNMGASLLASLCKELEDEVRRDCFDAVPGLVEQIEREFAIVRRLLRPELQHCR